MKKTIYLLCVFFFLASISLSSFAQTKVVINVGDDLITAIANATAGDTLYLKQGTHVARYENIDVDKSLVFIGEAGTELPKLYISQFDVYSNDIDITFSGLEISGATIDSLTNVEDLGILEADYFLNLVASTSALTYGDISVTNCIVRNFERCIVRGDRAAYSVKSFLFDNLIAYDFRGGGDYGPFRLKSKITMESFTISNSTMYNFLNKLIDCQNVVSSPMAVSIVNSTFNNIGGGKSGQYLFDIVDNDQASLSIQSCIFGTTNVTDLVTVNGWRVNAGANLEMLNSAMGPGFLLTSGTYALTEWDKIEYNLEDTDPQWLDPDNGDFTLPEGSDLLQWSPEGTVIGDPRWGPQSTEGVNSFSSDPGFEFYPNPANEEIIVKSNKANLSIGIYNCIGIRVKVVQNIAGEMRIGISDLETGLYFVKQEDANNRARKLMVK